MIMDIKSYNTQKIKEVLLYILQETGVISYYMLMKLLYIAERKHLAKWGTMITSSNFYAFKHGPVPTRIYYAICSGKNTKESFLSDIIETVGDYDVKPLREPNKDYLSKSDIESLDSSIRDNKDKDYSEIEAIVHDKYYKQAFKRKGKDRRMSIDEIARSGGADDDMLSYIHSQIEAQSALL